MPMKILSNEGKSEDVEDGVIKKRDITATEHHNNCFLSSLILIFLAPGFGGFLYGYDIGASAYAISAFSSEEFWQEGGEWRIGLFASTTTIAAFVGSLIIFPIADKIGRRQELIYSSALYFIGALWQASPAIHCHLTNKPGEPSELIMTDNIFWFGYILGRFIYGVGMGITMHGAPAYLGELIPPTIRGALLSLKEVFIVLGMLAGYIFGYILDTNEDEREIESGIANISNDDWAYAYIYSLGVSLTMFVLLQFFLPYSYRWLLLRGRSDEALESLRFLYKPGYAEEQYQILMKSSSSQEEKDSGTSNNGGSSLALFFDPDLRNSLIAGFGLVVLQQTTGQPSVLTYVATIFDDLGISALSSVLVALFKVLATMVAFVMVEKYGRKLLLFLGCTLMLIGTTTLVAFTATEPTISDVSSSLESTVAMIEEEERIQIDSALGEIKTIEELDSRNVSILIAMFIYIGGYQIGFGPITWLTMSEVFPISIRGQALSLAVQSNFLLNGVIEFGMALLQNRLGLSNTFAIFSILLVYALYFIHRRVLETKGLTLEEIEVMYRNHNKKKR